MKRIYLSLGSNLGDRMANLRCAIERLGEHGVTARRISSYYKTQPVDFLPQAWFVNCAVEAETCLMPLQLLSACKEIERGLGRRPGTLKGPRVIDIDILLYDNAVIHARELVVPHERMADRRFVLAPLCEISPGLRHPSSQRTMQELLHETQDQSQVVRIRAD
ncbi:MAG: 2-amino-4-hydroxy-6-hydroxymethyldihydropteridine diphosphokinase [Terriglobia bacterium]